MCGIAGRLTKTGYAPATDGVVKAIETLQHRGPDGTGFEKIELAGSDLALGHARLSIIDLSQGGNQPISSPDGRYVMVYNGEIYNYLELRNELQSEGCKFVSDSDSEVLLQSWIHWRENCLTKLVGMFAFAIVDTRHLRLSIVRDAFGIKPIYFKKTDNDLCFASEPAALEMMCDQRFQRNLDRMYDYLVHGSYDFTDATFAADCHQLSPGELMHVSIDDGLQVTTKRWWTPGECSRSSLSFADAADRFCELFLQSVKYHLRSDVSLGIALSGGLDSSAIICAARHLEPDMPIQSFSYIEAGSPLNEEQWIDIVNEEVKAIPHKVRVTDEELTADIEDLVRTQGEPFGSTSVYAQYRVMKAAREAGVTVLLDGQGADELLAGYHGYPGHRLMELLEQGNLLQAFRFSKAWGKWPGRSRFGAFADFGRIALPQNAYSLLRKALGRNFRPDWLRCNEMAVMGVDLFEQRESLSTSFRGRRLKEKMLENINGRGLRSLLRIADRNSMRFSIESRVPFLTLELFDFLYSLPEEFLISDEGETKAVMRRALRGIVPDRILDRRDKIGFETPQSFWLQSLGEQMRNDIYQWALDDPMIKEEELITKFFEVLNNDSNADHAWRFINYALWAKDRPVAPSGLAEH